ncbi:MAG TPA: BamA/TamA family outer membrane protein [Calditrichia bacterium]|nr:BamA/TamA family outer membrane protein [Calditrichota bacterium]HQV31645.1 BamA/TamA family outer membrane protein [Calditrichia bacterium]
MKPTANQLPHRHRPTHSRRLTSHFRRFAFWVFLLIAPGLVRAQEERTLLLERIDIEGNTKTVAGVIHNYLDMEVGSTISRDMVEAAGKRLEATRFFKTSELRLSPGTEKGQAVLTVIVTERRWPFFQFKSGYNELDGWYLSPLGIRFDNLLGYGNRLGLEFLIGDRISGARLGYYRPYLLGTEYDLGLVLEGNDRQFLHYPEGARELDEAFFQKVHTSELALSINGNSGIPRFFSMKLSVQAVTVDSTLRRRGDNEERAAPGVLLPPLENPYRTGRLYLATHIDTRDNRAYPSRGWWGSLSWEHAVFQEDSILNRDLKYSRTVLDLRRYQPIWKELVGAVRVKYGQISEASPFFERFYLGGPNSLRGYVDRSQNPLGYASRMTLSSAELRFPLSARLKDRSRFTGVLFYDAGFAWNESTTWNFSKLKTGMGAGVRLRIPVIGILRVDLAYPIPDYEPRLHISLGQTF